jgi:hypothetical protein
MYLETNFTYNFQQTPFNTYQDKGQSVVETGLQGNEQITYENDFIIWLKIVL